MRFVEVCGAQVARVGLGTWQFGSAEWGYGASYADETAAQIVQRALDLGMNLIDTAEAYAWGRSERIVGRAVADRRDEALIATKLTPVLPLEAVIEWRGVASADRLGVDCIDLYQLHWPNPVVPVSQQAAGLRRLQEAGVVDHVGVSNSSADRWFSLERALGGPVLSNQVSYSLVDRRAEQDVLPFAAACDRLVIAHSPLAQGLLGGRYGPGRRPGGLARQANPLFLDDNLAMVLPLLDVLRDIAGTHGATTAQISLAWVLRHPNVVVIAGASDVEQLEANAAAAEIELSSSEVRALDEASAAFRPRVGAARLPDLVRAQVGAGT